MSTAALRMKRLLGVFAIFAATFWWALPAGAQTARLISADYGIGEYRVDVTSRIQSLARDGYLNLRVTNENLGVGDPAPHQGKELRIRVREGHGRIRDYSFREGAVANVQIGSGGRDPDGDYDDDADDLRILQAYYGANNQTIDVANRLRQWVRDGRLQMHVNNDSMGNDPDPEHRKALFVLYRYQGQRRTAIVLESGDLAIP